MLGKKTKRSKIPMTQGLANRNVFLLPMNNKTCQQGRGSHSRSSFGWIAAALIAVLALLTVTAPATRVMQ
jgi:hypothetical protein